MQSAEITKLSAVYFFEWIKKNNLVNKVLFVNQVHDENVVECPKEIAEEVKQALYTAMINSGKLYCKRVPLKVDPGITEYWKK